MVMPNDNIKVLKSCWYVSKKYSIIVLKKIYVYSAFKADFTVYFL